MTLSLTSLSLQAKLQQCLQQYKQDLSMSKPFFGYLALEVVEERSSSRSHGGQHHHVQPRKCANVIRSLRVVVPGQVDVAYLTISFELVSYVVRPARWVPVSKEYLSPEYWIVSRSKSRVS